MYGLYNIVGAQNNEKDNNIHLVIDSSPKSSLGAIVLVPAVATAAEAGVAVVATNSNFPALLGKTSVRPPDVAVPVVPSPAVVVRHRPHLSVAVPAAAALARS